ncbi:MAG: DUF6855 family protein [Geodermatophilaceae bacterium]
MGAGTGGGRACAVASGVYLPPLLEALGLVELEHNAGNNRVRALPRK